MNGNLRSILVKCACHARLPPSPVVVRRHSSELQRAVRSRPETRLCFDPKAQDILDIEISAVERGLRSSQVDSFPTRDETLAHRLLWIVRQQRGCRMRDQRLSAMEHSGKIPTHLLSQTTSRWWNYFQGPKSSERSHYQSQTLIGPRSRIRREEKVRISRWWVRNMTP